MSREGWAFSFLMVVIVASVVVIGIVVWADIRLEEIAANKELALAKCEEISVSLSEWGK